MALLGGGTCVRLTGSQMQVDDDGAQSATRPDVPSRGSAGSEAGCWFLLAATIALLMGRIPIIFIRAFDNDEFEHTHAAWSVFRGLLPYKDFFEHHTPWYYFALSPFFRWFAVDRSFDSARHFLIFGRDDDDALGDVGTRDEQLNRAQPDGPAIEVGERLLLFAMKAR